MAHQSSSQVMVCAKFLQNSLQTLTQAQVILFTQKMVNASLYLGQDATQDARALASGEPGQYHVNQDAGPNEYKYHKVEKTTPGRSTP